MQGTIVCLRSGNYHLYNHREKTFLKAKASGLFRHHQITPKVGDHVEYELMNEKEAYITKIYPRKNELTRPPIANVGQALVLFSVKEPILNTNLLDRLLALLNFYLIEAIIVLTKWDLLTQDEQDENIKYEQYYQKIGYRVISVSLKEQNEAVRSQINQILKNKTTILIGQSGVGKSSLLNFLYDDLNLKTDGISKSLNRGKHTTRHTELFQIEEGFVADSPGFGITEFFEMTKADLAHNFAEFFTHSHRCRFSGCLHQKEPGCAVKEAIVSGEILSSRYQNYLLFLEEINLKKKW